MHLETVNRIVWLPHPSALTPPPPSISLHSSSCQYDFHGSILIMASIKVQREFMAALDKQCWLFLALPGRAAAGGPCTAFSRRVWQEEFRKQRTFQSMNANVVARRKEIPGILNTVAEPPQPSRLHVFSFQHSHNEGRPHLRLPRWPLTCTKCAPSITTPSNL